MSGKHGTVALFLSPLPPNFTRRDLKAFLCRELRKVGVRGIPLFRLCTNCSILRITDRAAGTVEYHGLVEVRPARVAMQAVQLINGTEVNGTLIEVRRYRHRSLWGEHRHRSNAGQGGPLVAHPLTERRRAHLHLELVSGTPAVTEYGNALVANA
ncbi:MAG TPA: RNA-binding protein [Lamprocystis sp. (in: g-proteobacteria)]|nr:RNA-binding protein [Lamprocystis sp. (in: g-proteobacteria)]